MWIETKLGTSVNLAMTHRITTRAKAALTDGDLIDTPFAVVADNTIIAGVPSKAAGDSLIREILEHSISNAHGVMKL